LTTGSKHKIPVICLFGPTAIGKTDSLKLFSKHCEIINADSMQVYKYMDIGTAKPAPDVLQSIPHHLIDCIEPDIQFNAGMFVEQADKLCAEIYSRAKIPMIAGGTAFYFTNFINGLPETPPSDPFIKKSVIERFEKIGSEAMWKELAAIDKITAERLPPNDKQRIMRAIEIYETSGKPLSAYKKGQGRSDTYDFLIIGLKQERKKLYETINQRVKEMLAAGLQQEVNKLLELGYSFNDPGMKGIGYREFSVFNNQNNIDLPSLENEIAKNTRRYAKRQITFFSRIPDTIWIEAGNRELLQKTVHTFIQNKL
jgi:tRNA dimethylallyltransferase